MELQRLMSAMRYALAALHLTLLLLPYPQNDSWIYRYISLVV